MRKKRPLRDLLDYLGMTSSSYFYHHQRVLKPNKYDMLKRKIIELFEVNGGRYGYRRIHALLLRDGIQVSEKVVRHNESRIKMSLGAMSPLEYRRSLNLAA